MDVSALTPAMHANMDALTAATEWDFSSNNAGVEIAQGVRAANTSTEEKTDNRLAPKFPVQSRWWHDDKGYPLKINATIGVLQNNPIFTPGVANLAVSAAMTRSQVATN